MSPSKTTTGLYFLTFLTTLAFVGPYGAGAVWIVFFCVCFVQLKPALPPAVEEVRDEETAMKSQREYEAMLELLQKLTNALALSEKIHVLFLVLCKVLLGTYFRRNVPLLPPAPVRANLTNVPHQPGSGKRTGVEEDKRVATEDTGARWQLTVVRQEGQVNAQQQQQPQQQQQQGQSHRRRQLETLLHYFTFVSH